ncbi:MAG: DUF4433 domain-containing protein [Arcobacteraceae bacterium]|nr:DUF4433 domain-containing protein [Arcobacteraceae bacterium]
MTEKEEYLVSFKSQQKKRFKNGFQNWWIDFIFHYNDLHNIVSILNSGKLYSRNKVTDLAILKKDIANDDVISHTDINVHNYVRFYFGAKTPTLYNNEGLIPTNEIKDNAHCPVPIFLLFDFINILSMDNSYFSNGNMGAKNPEVYSDVIDLNKLEWNYIYHRESLYGYENYRHINYCRNAEVLIENELNIYDSLKWICVRSIADKETILNLVNPDAKERIKNKIKVFTSDGLFHNKRLFLNEVVLHENRIDVNFINTNNKIFTVEVYMKSLSNGKEINIKKDNYKVSSNFYLDIKELDKSQGIYFILSIDNYKVYDNILFDTNEILI